jgi:hypothetical protein
VLRSVTRKLSIVFSCAYRYIDYVGWAKGAYLYKVRYWLCRPMVSNRLGSLNIQLEDDLAYLAAAVPSTVDEDHRE